MRRFLTLGAGVTGTFANVFVKDGPRLQSPAFPLGSIGRTRQ
jgi:hypothetical protein